VETRSEFARVLRTTSRISLLFEPGTKYQYSNFNYVLLGILIETVAGTGWEDYLREEVFRPAGLRDTRYDDVWTVIPGRVTGYRRKEGQFLPIPYKDHAAYSCGGLLSSAQDLFTFSQALFEGDLLNPSQLAEMTRPRLGNYGLGLQIVDLNGRTAYNHTGGIDGFSSHLQYYPRDKVTVIVLANTEEEPVKKIATDIAGFALGH
jgi:D-alanyl-D-alanine carboxypeptidase